MIDLAFDTRTGTWFPAPVQTRWQGLVNLPPIDWVCGYCGNKVGTQEGYVWVHERPDTQWRIYICSRCDRPSFYADGKWTPAAVFGESVSDLPADVEEVFEQARRSMAVSAHTGAVMLCRKILIHVAVEKGAKPGIKFQQAIEHLENNNYLPRDTKQWIEKIRDMGNVANHEIYLISKEEAEATLKFTTMLLRIVYDYPAMAKNL